MNEILAEDIFSFSKPNTPIRVMQPMIGHYSQWVYKERNRIPV